MTPEQVRGAIRSAPMTQKELAELLGISHGHLRNVASGSKELGKSAQKLLKMVVNAR